MSADYLIVGAGFAGCILAERLASELGKKVIIVDKRDHVGGNCYDYPSEEGILIHKYGPHVFHTNSEKTRLYLSRFTDWTAYEHRVLAEIDGMRVPVPFNFNSLEALFPEARAKELERELLGLYGEGLKVPILKLRASDSGAVRELAEYVYEKVFLGYTLKQWGMSPEELDSSVTSRVPVLIGRDDRYFQDSFQAMPSEGYAKLFERLINHPNIELRLSTDFFRDPMPSADKLIFTGALDEYFGYKRGALPYRSLNFVINKFETERYQEVAQLNYPNAHAYTRTTEFKHFLNQKCASTQVTFEYPTGHVRGETEPYYPIPFEESARLAELYRKDAELLSPGVRFIGRLAEYRYYNMDQIIGVALLTFEKIARNKE
ncbi:MAG: UDP-galactopyranose mutase [Chloroflexota bacterium]